MTQTVSQLLGGAACCRFRLLSHSLSLFLPLRVYFSQAGRLLNSCFRIPPLKHCGVSPLCFAPPFSVCSTCPCLSADSSVEIQFSRLLQSRPTGAATVFSGETDGARSREEENECGVWSLSYCASQLLNVKVLPFQNRVEEIQRPSLTLSVHLVTPHLPSRTLSHTFFLSITVLTFIYLLWIPFYSVILQFISADFSISASFVGSAFTRHHYNI